MQGAPRIETGEFASSFRSVLSDLAGRYNDHEAILAPGRPPLTFSALTDRVSITKQALNGLGIGRGDRLAIVLPSGPEMAVCLLSALACTIAVPLAPSSTKDELRQHLIRTRPKAVVISAGSDSPVRDVAGELGIASIELVPAMSAAAGAFTLRGVEAPCPDESWNSADDIGVILLTSGTTAAQKLVPVKPRHQIAYARGINTIFGLGPADRSLIVMPLFHASGLNSSFLIPLLNGAGLVCLAEFDVTSFFKNLDVFRPTFITAGYALLKAILDGVEAHRAIVKRSQIRFIRSGTGRLDPSIKRGLEEAFGAPVIEQYSTSETGVIACWPMPPARAKAGTVGRPIVNEVAILDSAGRSLGAEQEGEIAVRGPSVFDGYLGDPQANESAFTDGWYKTGDFGRLDSDGFLTVTGRVKEVINRGGEKISPREIESIVAAHSAVKDVKAFGIFHPTLGQEVVAAVVLHDKSVGEEDLKAFATQRLAGFKVPRRIFVRDAFPLARSKKLDVRALVRECEAVLDAERTVPVATDRPLSATQQAVLELWCRILKTKHIGLKDDFFLLGGDSLSAVELLMLVERHFGIQLPVDAMYGEAATVSGLASRIDQRVARSSPQNQEEPAISPPLTESHRKRRRILCSADLVTLLTFLGLLPAAWLLPRNTWPSLSELFARAHIGIKGLPAKDLQYALELLGVHLSSQELQRGLLSGVYEDLLITLREHLPLAWQPNIRLDGIEHIASAQAAGRGAVLWSCPSPFGGLIFKKALRSAGIQVISLRSSIHPYSGTCFGMNMLNPIRTRIEDRYTAGTVVLDSAHGAIALQELRRHLQANAVVAIAANGSEGTPFEMPFLGGTLKLSLGAPTLAALHGAPLLPLFTTVDAVKGFEVTVKRPLAVESHGDAGEAARQLARAYVPILETHLRRHPTAWRGWFMRNTWSPTPSHSA